MDSVQFATAYVPTEIEVAGAHVRLFFTLQAAMKMEASLKRPYLETVLMMLQAEDEMASRSRCHFRSRRKLSVF